MNFDVVIGNPPYQDAPVGQEGKAFKYMAPLYHKIINSVKDIGDNLVFIIPARFLSSNKEELKEFKNFINSQKIIGYKIYSDSDAIFNNVLIDGGVIYFGITYKDKDYIGCSLSDHINIKYV